MNLLGVALWLLSTSNFAADAKHPAVVRMERAVPIEGTLKWDTKVEELFLCLRNNTDQDVAVLRWRGLYEVKVLDAEEKQISDFHAYLSRGKHAGPLESEWLVLRPRDAITFLVRMATAKGYMRVPLSGVAAECRFLPTRMLSIEPPQFVMDAKARLAKFGTTGRIRIESAPPTN